MKERILLTTGVVLLLGSLTLFIILATGCCHTPDFITSQGVEVYTNDVVGLTEEKVDMALEFYAVSFPELIKEISEEEIRDILRRTTLEWKPEAFRCWLHSTKDWGLCNGTQLGYYLTVRWTGYIQGCALFHELTHEVMEFVMGTIDYQHSWKEWWDATETLKRDYSELGIE